MLQSNPSKTVEKLVRLHCRKLPHKVSKAFKAGAAYARGTVR